MDEDFIECHELAGKQIEALRIYKDTGDGTELQIDFPDGRASVAVCNEAGLRSKPYSPWCRAC